MDSESDSELINAVASVVVKIVMIISATVLVLMWQSSCQLNADTVAICEESCSSNGGNMKSVTSNECICVGRDSSSPIWSLPSS